MTLASIDIGSNTVILLIAEFDKNTCSLTPLQNYYRVPRISTEVKEKNYITDNSLQKLIVVLDEYKKYLTDYNIEHIFVKATNAFRISKNGNEIRKLLSEKYNWNIEIISGEKEAELTFLGSLMPNFYDNKGTVIDIGGGSTEIITGDVKNILFKKSYPVGIVSLFEKHVHSSIPSSTELENIKHEIQESFSGLEKVIDNRIKILAVAGTPTTLSAIQQGIKSYSEDIVEDTILRKEYIEIFIDELKELSPNQIKEMYGKIVEGREDLILVGSIILYEFMKKVNVDEVIVSSRGLRYGAIWDYLISSNLISI